jgi:short-subunit dehydrogenase
MWPPPRSWPTARPMSPRCGETFVPPTPEDVYEPVRRRGRPLDLVALNAGTGRAGRFIDDDLATDMNVIDLNVLSTVHLAKLMLAAMVERGAGKVLFTSSVVAMMPGSYQSMYNASKSFIKSSPKRYTTSFATWA